MGVRSHIGVQFVLKILLGAEGGWSHKTSRSYNRGSYNAGTTVLFLSQIEFDDRNIKSIISILKG